jgi:DNA helicase-2/ATP-dependent DNA helicase PcrA
MSSAKSARRNIRFEPDERQREAIEHVHGPMLVLAGAGTGKTTVLTRRIAELIRNGHARPNQILALTYTDNAAAEMHQRVQQLLQGTDVSGLRATTFHAYCNVLLRENGREFGVLDDKDLWIFLRKRIRELDLNYFVRAANITQFLDDLLDFIRRCHDELVGPEGYAAYVGRLERGEIPVPRVTRSKDVDDLSDEEILGRCKEIAAVFAKVERMLADENLGTFSHMITRAHQLLRHDPQLLARERERARFLLGDEFQDANFAQVKILSALAGEERNVFAVGDPDQAIYRFRGASSAAFGLFHRHFPKGRMVVLDENQRSTTPILRCAFSIIEQNPPVFHAGVSGENAGRVYRRAPLHSAREKRAQAEGRPFPSLPVEIVPLSGRDMEAVDVAADIEEKHHEGRARWSNFAVLYRSHLHRDELARELGLRGIPFAIENMDVLDTPEVRDVLACVGALDSEADAASLLRVAALPQFNIDPERFRAALRSVPRNQPSSPVTLAVLLREVEGGPAVLESLRQVREEIARAGMKSVQVLELVMRRFGFQRDFPPLRALLKFVQGWQEKPLTRTGQIGELLEYLRYFREARGSVCLQSGGEDAVRLMTAHAAKGLEFAHVYIIRATPPSFPGSYKEPLVEFPQELRDADSVGEGDRKALHEEEERRLFYVAMTRAKDTLTLYGKQGTGKKDKTPPGMLRELLNDRRLGSWLVARAAREFQTDLFAHATPLPPFVSRTAEWLELPPAFPLTRLSATAVESYDLCPLQFKLEREWRISRDVPAAMQYGASMHRVLKTYFDAVRMDRPLSEAELIDLFKADLAQAAIEDAYQRELYERQGVQQLQDFHAHLRRSGLPKVLHTEEQFEVRVGEATVVGRIDRIDDLGHGRVAIVDYKTGKPRAQEDADESLQLSIYAIAAQQKWGYQADRLAFYNLEENSSVTTSRERLELENAKAKVAEVADQIAAGKFDPSPGYHCRLCSYRNLCPATEKPVHYPVPAKGAAVQ